MRKLLVLFCLTLTCSFVFAAKETVVTKAYADNKGIVHIVTADGRERTIHPKKWQARGGFHEIKVAPDGKTVGWLVDYMLAPFEGGTNYSYTVSPELDIW
jgi:hypothetical protein